jgi:integrase/recombinase XerD
MRPTNKGRRFPPDPLTVDEALSIIRVCDIRARVGVRTRAHLALLWRCGLRSAEACSLDLCDFREGDPCSIRILAPKGAGRGMPPRELSLDVGTCELLRAWIAVRGREAGPLLNTDTGGRLTTSYLRRALPRLARRAGIQRRVHPHGLRHTFARHMADEGVGVKHIQEGLGHRRLDTTAVYLSSIGSSEVGEIMAAREFTL